METVQSRTRARSGARVLVVDDEPAVAELLRRLLTKEGYEVHVRATATPRSRAVAQHNPHVVLLDVNMPGPTGIEVCRHIKSNPTSASRP